MPRRFQRNRRNLPFRQKRPPVQLLPRLVSIEQLDTSLVRIGLDTIFQAIPAGAALALVSILDNFEEFGLEIPAFEGLFAIVDLTPITYAQCKWMGLYVTTSDGTVLLSNPRMANVPPPA
jgi:hypothetical protein